jgi:hypothetical protein
MVRLVTYIRLSTHVSSTKLKKGHIHVSHGVRSMTMCALMFVITISYIASEDRVCGLN